MLSWLVRRACETVEEPLSLSIGVFFNREVGTDSPFLVLKYKVQDKFRFKKFFQGNYLLLSVAVVFAHADLAIITLKPFYSLRLEEFSA